MRSAQRESVESPAANPIRTVCRGEMRQMVNNKSKKIVMLVGLSIADVDCFQFEFANGAASGSE
jgi:hypothetical protein